MAAPAFDSRPSPSTAAAPASQHALENDSTARATSRRQLDDDDESLPPVLTADELARLLRVNRKTVYAGFRSGEIPGGKRIGGTIRFSRDAVLRWLSEGQVSRSSRGSR